MLHTTGSSNHPAKGFEARCSILDRKLVKPAGRAALPANAFLALRLDGDGDEGDGEVGPAHVLDAEPKAAA